MGVVVVVHGKTENLIMWNLSSRRESESKKSTARVRVALPGLFFCSLQTFEK